jgi:hypothetical protein
MAIEISADDNAAVKRKMQLEMEKGTEEEDIVLLATVLNPFTKEFSFYPNLRYKAHQLPRCHAQSVSSVPFLHAKKEKEHHDAEGSELPPHLTFTEEIDMKENNNNAPPSKKIQAVDTEDWLGDVMYKKEYY